MYDASLVRDILEQIIEAIGRIERRSEGLGNPNDFLSSDDGIDRYDAICMMLIAIGESCKKLDKITGGTLFPRYSETDWKGVKGMRDILSHQHFDLNAEVVYAVCKKHIPELRTVFEKMARELDANGQG